MMIKITRRDLLKTSLASSVLMTGCRSGSPPAVKDASPTQKLMVVFHGTFVFSFDARQPQADQLTVVAPLVKDAAHPEEDHVYKARALSIEVDLLPGVYRLSGATAGSISAEGSGFAKQFIAVQGVNTHDPKETNVVFKLPLPDKFRGLRYMTPKDKNGTPIDLFEDGSTKTQNDVRPDQVPLVIVATYNKAVAPSLMESSTVAKLTVGGTILHIYAEPISCPGPGHISNALSMLCSLFTPELDLKLNPQLKDQDATPPAADPEGEVPPVEQNALCKLLAVNPATKIRNCHAVIVTPPRV